MIELVVALSILAVVGSVAVFSIGGVPTPARYESVSTVLANAELAARRRGSDVLLVASGERFVILDPASHDTLMTGSWPTSPSGDDGRWRMRVTPFGHVVPAYPAGNRR